MSRPTPKRRRSRSPSPTSRRASRSTCGSRSSRIARSSPAAPRSGTSEARRADLRCAMSSRLDLPDADWIMVGLAGAWARERHVVERALVPGRQSVIEHARRVEPPAQPVPRPAAGRRTDEAHGEAYGFSLVYSGNFLAEAEVEPYGTARVRIGIEPDDVRLAPRARGCVHDAGGHRGLLGDGLGGAVGRVPLAVPRAPRTRGLARPPATGPDQQLGGDLLRLRRRQAGRDRAPARELGVELFVLDDGWFGEARRRHDLARATGSSTGASCPTGSTASPRGSRRWAWGSGCGSSPRWSAPRATCSGPTRTGRSASRAGHGPRAASSSSSTWPAPRSSTTSTGVLAEVLGSAPISYVKWDMNRNITEPWTRVAAARPPGRVLPPLHPRRLRAVPAADRRASRRSCSSRAPAAAGGSTRACSRSRRRRGRATAPTPSSACGSSGAPRWPTR